MIAASGSAVTKVVAAGILNVVASGSGALVELANKAIEATSETAEEIAEDQFQGQLLAYLSLAPAIGGDTAATTPPTAMRWPGEAVAAAPPVAVPTLAAFR